MATFREHPIEGPAQDTLGRQRLCRDVYRVITESPADWSLRIGIFGTWGEGKTSVVNLVIDRARADGHIIGKLSPWRCSSSSDLMVSLAEAILVALKESSQANESPHVKQVIVDIEKRLRRRRGRTILKSALSIFGNTAKSAGEALEEIGGEALSTFFEVSQSELERLHEALKPRRLLIVIDDLDRCDPRFIPGLLMALRETLDQPGLCFLLSFDDEIVSRSLSEYHPAWSQGSDFLDKILDFKFSLPSLSRQACGDFAIKEAGELGKYFGVDLLRGAVASLPNNPRKIKEFLRHAFLLRQHTTTHNQGEIDWQIVFVLLALQLKSGRFMERVVEELLLRDQSWSALILRTNLLRSEGGKNVKAEFVEQLTEQARDASVTLEKDLVETLYGYATEPLAIERVRYARDLLLAPHCMTWREFGELARRPKGRITRKSVGSWLLRCAKKAEMPRAQAADELLDAGFAYWSQKLHALADCLLESQRVPLLQDARAALHLVRVVVLEGLPGLAKNGYLSPTVFSRLLAVAMHWAPWATASGDAALRAEEREFLEEFLKNVDNGLLRFLELDGVAPWNRHALPPSLRGGESTLLRDHFASLVGPAAARECVPCFASPELMRRLTSSHNENSARIYLLFSPDPASVPKSCKSEVLEVLSRASTDVNVQLSCYHYLRLMADAVRRGLGQVSFEEVQQGLEGDFVSAVWQAATASPFQYRALPELGKIRDSLGEQGVHLELPAWASEAEST